MISLEGDQCPELRSDRPVVDIIWTFGKYYQLRVNRDEIPFCASKAWDNKDKKNILIPFRPETEIVNRNVRERKRPIDIVTIYADHLSDTLLTEWDNFMADRDYRRPKAYTNFFGSDYLQTLRRDAIHFVEQSTQGEVAVDDVLPKAIHNGAVISTRLSSIFQNQLKLITAIALSKISLPGLDDALTYLSFEGTHQGKRPVNFEMFHNPNHTGLNPKVLEKWEHNKGHGCPAAMPPSVQTVDLMRDKIAPLANIPVSREAMLVWFTQAVHEDFSRIVDWYHNLRPDEKREFVTPESREQLESIYSQP